MGYTDDGIGFQNRDTSIEAAISDKKGKLSLREQAYQVIEEAASPLSADDVANILDRPFISIRPRITELCNQKRIQDSGLRGKTQWGKKCILWETYERGDWLE